MPKRKRAKISKRRFTDDQLIQQIDEEEDEAESSAATLENPLVSSFLSYVKKGPNVSDRPVRKKKDKDQTKEKTKDPRPRNVFNLQKTGRGTTSRLLNPLDQMKKDNESRLIAKADEDFIKSQKALTTDSNDDEECVSQTTSSTQVRTKNKSFFNIHPPEKKKRKLKFADTDYGYPTDIKRLCEKYDGLTAFRLHLNVIDRDKPTITVENRKLLIAKIPAFVHDYKEICWEMLTEKMLAGKLKPIRITGVKSILQNTITNLKEGCHWISSVERTVKTVMKLDGLQFTNEDAIEFLINIPGLQEDMTGEELLNSCNRRWLFIDKFIVVDWKNLDPSLEKGTYQSPLLSLNSCGLILSEDENDPLSIDVLKRRVQLSRMYHQKEKPQKKGSLFVQKLVQETIWSIHVDKSSFIIPSENRLPSEKVIKANAKFFDKNMPINYSCTAEENENTIDYIGTHAVNYGSLDVDAAFIKKCIWISANLKNYQKLKSILKTACDGNSGREHWHLCPGSMEFLAATCRMILKVHCKFVFGNLYIGGNRNTILSLEPLFHVFGECQDKCCDLKVLVFIMDEPQDRVPVRIFVRTVERGGSDDEVEKNLQSIAIWPYHLQFDEKRIPPKNLTELKKNHMKLFDQKLKEGFIVDGVTRLCFMDPDVVNPYAIVDRRKRLQVGPNKQFLPPSIQKLLDGTLYRIEIRSSESYDQLEKLVRQETNLLKAKRVKISYEEMIRNKKWKAKENIQNAASSKLKSIEETIEGVLTRESSYNSIEDGGEGQQVILEESWHIPFEVERLSNEFDENFEIERDVENNEGHAGDSLSSDHAIPEDDEKRKLEAECSFTTLLYIRSGSVPLHSKSEGASSKGVISNGDELDYTQGMRRRSMSIERSENKESLTEWKNFLPSIVSPLMVRSFERDWNYFEILKISRKRVIKLSYAERKLVTENERLLSCSTCLYQWPYYVSELLDPTYLVETGAYKMWLLATDNISEEKRNGEDDQIFNFLRELPCNEYMYGELQEMLEKNYPKLDKSSETVYHSHCWPQSHPLLVDPKKLQEFKEELFVHNKLQPHSKTLDVGICQESERKDGSNYGNEKSSIQMFSLLMGASVFLSQNSSSHYGAIEEFVEMGKKQEVMVDNDYDEEMEMTAEGQSIIEFLFSKSDSLPENVVPVRNKNMSLHNWNRLPLKEKIKNCERKFKIKLPFATGLTGHLKCCYFRLEHFFNTKAMIERCGVELNEVLVDRIKANLYELFPKLNGLRSCRAVESMNCEVFANSKAVVCDIYYLAGSHACFFTNFKLGEENGAEIILLQFCINEPYINLKIKKYIFATVKKLNITVPQSILPTLIQQQGSECEGWTTVLSVLYTAAVAFRKDFLNLKINTSLDIAESRLRRLIWTLYSEPSEANYRALVENDFISFGQKINITNKTGLNDSELEKYQTIIKVKGVCHPCCRLPLAIEEETEVLCCIMCKEKFHSNCLIGLGSRENQQIMNEKDDYVITCSTEGNYICIYCIDKQFVPRGCPFDNGTFKSKLMELFQKKGKKNKSDLGLNDLFKFCQMINSDGGSYNKSIFDKVVRMISLKSDEPAAYVHGIHCLCFSDTDGLLNEDGLLQDMQRFDLKQAIRFIITIYGVLEKRNLVMVPFIIDGSALISFIYRSSKKIVTFNPLYDYTKDRDSHQFRVTAAVSYSLKGLLKSGQLLFDDLGEDYIEFPWVPYVSNRHPICQSKCESFGVVSAIVMQTGLGNPYQYIDEGSVPYWLNLLFRQAVCGVCINCISNNQQTLHETHLIPLGSIYEKFVCNAILSSQWYNIRRLTDLRIQPE